MMVDPADKITPDMLKFFLQKLIDSEQQVAESLEEISAIAEKIKVWKEKFGDLQAQDRAVFKALKPEKRIKVHNAKTLYDKLNTIQQDIGLTSEEVTIIVFSSLN